jgi:hypothetical protein
LRELPNFGELYSIGEDPSYVTDQGAEVWMYRKVGKVRFYDRVANQVGPQHANVIAAMMWALANGWSNPSNAQSLNAEAAGKKRPPDPHIFFIP